MGDGSLSEEDGLPSPAESRSASGGEPEAGYGSPAEVFGAFLKLGLTSFGGPLAHLGYFREELVVRRRWLGEERFADLVALCQFLPGPASSQVGFALGVLRGGGLLGGVAAWAGFTAPSALMLAAFASFAAAWQGPVAQGALHGLKLVAVAVVAQAVLGMARALVPDRWRGAVVVAAVGATLVVGGWAGLVAAILLGALTGVLVRGRSQQPTYRLSRAGPAIPVSRLAGTIALALFAALLLLPQLTFTAEDGHLALFHAFFRAGALVFGGGHVVLPLLEAQVVAHGWLSRDAFLAGYGFAQAVPGPLFTFAAYLGAAAGPPSGGLIGSAAGLAGVFLPGMLLVYGVLPFWDALRRLAPVRAAMMGANAAVVGVLLAALYDPIAKSALTGWGDLALAVGGLLLLMVGRAPPWVVVLALATTGALLGSA